MKLETGAYYEIVTNSTWGTKIVVRFDYLNLENEAYYSSGLLVFTVTSTDDGKDRTVEIEPEDFKDEYFNEGRVTPISNPPHEDLEEF